MEKYSNIIKLKSSDNNIWFTSDMHFNHRNIIKFCNRPYENVEEMNNALIENWNNVVGKDDIVFNLGDFLFGNKNKWKEIISKLNGHHYLILGNHDMHRYPGDSVMDMFDGVYNQLLITIDDRYVYLNHYPFLCYGGALRGKDNAVYQLFGHVHSGPKSTSLDTDRLIALFPYQYDVGVDNNNYRPISWNEVKEKIENQIKYGVRINSIKHTIPDKEYLK